MRLIGIVFILTAFTMFSIPVTDAGPLDVWNQCTQAEAVTKIPKEGLTCCEIDGSLRWESDCTKPITFVTATSPPEPLKLVSTYTFGLWTKNDVNIILTCTDKGGSGCKEVRFCTTSDCTPSTGDPLVTTKTIDISGEGTTHVKYASVDNTGNVEATETKQVKIDKTPPTTTPSLSGTLGSNGWFISDVKVTLSCSDIKQGIDTSGCSITKYCDTGPECTPDKTYSAPFTKIESSSVRYQSTDNAGNIEQIKSIEPPVPPKIPPVIKIDKTPPTTTILATSPPDGATYEFNKKTRNDVKVTLSCTDNPGGSGCSTTKYCIFSSDTCTPDKDPPAIVSTEGTTFVRFRSTDVAGNSEAIQSKLVNIDKTPPVRSNGQPSGTITTSSPTLSLNTNEAATCKYSSTSGQTYDSMTNTFSTTGGTSHSQTVPGLGPTSHNYFVKCKDEVNNKNTDDFIISFGVCLRSNPKVTIIPTSQQGEPSEKKDYTVTVSNDDQNCGTEKFDLTKTGCPTGWMCTLPSSLSIASGSSQTATLSITSSSTAPAKEVKTINVNAKNQAAKSFEATATASYEVICTYRLSVQSSPNFVTGKHGSFEGVQKTWTVTLKDTGSSNSCGPRTPDNTQIKYNIQSIEPQGLCHQQTGIWTGRSNPPAGSKISLPVEFLLKPGDTNSKFDLNVFVKRQGSKPCTVSFNIKAGATDVDPSFTVSLGTGPKQDPHVGLIDFSGDKTTLNVKWEAFYPDNDPFRDMKVKCALFNPTDNSCDPEKQDCSNVPGKTCSIYDASQGTEELKKGSCDVSSPGFDFNNNNKIICIFYDLSDASLKTRVEPSFTPVDFAITSANEIITTVGDKFDLKIDVTNKGTLADSYRIDFSGPGTIDISPTTITTPTIGPNQVVSAFSSVTPVVDQTGTLTVKVTSLTSGKFIEKDIQVSPGLFALPEFGLIGFLQIIAIAAIIYFLFIKSGIKSKKRRR